jgi:MFS family permease
MQQTTEPLGEINVPGFWLRQGRPQLMLAAYISLCAFVVYSCMFGFRKPYTVAAYSGIYFLGISYKVCLVIAQVLGYMCSKFYGIKFISAMQPKRRAAYIILCIGIAWVSLLLFAVVPPPYNIICMFVNGLPLGMVFGLVFGFLEGRRTTELMGAVMAASFIFAAGLAKTTGKWLLLDFDFSDWWMPFATGAFFVVPLLVSVWLLSKAPPPAADDIAHRTQRRPMTGVERKNFILQFGTSIIPIIAAYIIFTVVRDFCEDFANELWAETGYKNNAGIFAKTNTIVSVICLAVIGGFFLIRNNYRAFRASHFIIMSGVLLAAVSTAIFNLHFISAFTWMVLSVTGMYLAYIPFNCMYFERMLATYKVNGNVGFVMYIADAFGYLGTVTVLLIKEFFPVKYNWVNFFSFLFYTAAVMGVILICISLAGHSKLYKKITGKNQLPGAVMAPGSGL